ncbi:MAG: TRAP transporter substrate-binding protein DctP [Desulfatiglans sp.]|jgi:TRAP-type mannitol/chloroaromatic compound transport system substrate-binding protein|nr:TRAP transporter substrate-binding protein DctP [Desulfatiglans sp.]
MRRSFIKETALGIATSLFLIVAISGGVRAETIHWKMASCWPPSIPLIESDKKFVKFVNEASGERLKIKLFTAGQICPPFELLDNVSSGVVQVGGDWAGYWAGKDTAFSLIGSFPMLMGAVDYQLWLYEGGGIELCNEVYNKFGVRWLPHSVLFSESGIRSNKPIESLNDYKGMKIRLSGRPQGEVLKRIGGTQVMLSGGEIYQALEKGTIDGGEFSGPSLDWPMGFAEVTKYWCSPGWHQPGSVLSIVINQKAWEKLPDDLKKLVECAAMATFNTGTAWLEYGNINATKKFIEKGVKLSRLNDEDLAKIQEISFEVLVNESKKNPLFAKIAKSQIKFLNDMAHWREISAPFSHGRNVRKLPNID